jgi:hypothetical protein
MESGSALDLFALLGEGDTLGGDFLVELCDGCDVLVDDRLVDKRPKSFGGLQLRGVGRQINEANAIGDFEISWPMPPRIVEHEKDDAAQACFGFACEGCKQRLEKILRHSVGNIPEGFACRR